MPILFPKGETLVLASHNQGKIKEFRHALATAIGTLLSASDLNLPEPEETGTTFEENARLKATLAAEATGKIVLADDSGLIVSALGDRPGIYSARWAGPNKDFSLAIDKINQELAALEQETGQPVSRDAYFTVCLCLAYPDGTTYTVEARTTGTLHPSPAGTEGMGYDPWFQPDGYDCRFAEMSLAQKQAISHRGKAIQKLLTQYFEG